MAAHSKKSAPKESVNARGRPAFKAKDDERSMVRAMAGYGISEADIALVVRGGVDPKTLRKHFRAELDTGHVLATAKVAESLYKRATGDGTSAVTAAIFWLKTRAGWKETSVHEHSGKDGAPIETEEVSDFEKMRRLAFMFAKAAHEKEAFELRGK